MTMNRLMGLRVLVLGVILGMSSLALAQADANKVVDLSPRALVSDQLLLLAKKSLTSVEQPDKAQLQSARMLLELALELSPQDAELYRHMIELTRQLRLPQEQLQAQSAYCNLRPQDDVAQLELILLKLQSMQTIENRMAALDRILDHPSSARLSAALRSRLASAIAQGAYELGDQARLANRLEQAVRLDPTNKPAMRMIHALTLSKKGTPVEQGVALLGLLKADPLDPATRRDLAELLLEQGAYAQAVQQYQVSQSLIQQPADALFYQCWIQALIACGRFEDAQALFLGLDQQASQQSQPQSTANSTGQPTEPAAAATQPIRLNTDLEVLRLLLFHRTARSESSGQSMTWLSEHLRNQPQQADREIQALWLTVLLAPDDWTITVPASISQALPANDPLLARINAFILLRQGKFEQATKLFQAQPQDDPFVLFGQALAQGGNQTPAGQAMLQRAIRQAPTSLAAIMAASSLAKIKISASPTPAGQTLTQLVDRLSLMLRQPELGDGKWIRLESRIQPVNYNYLDPITVRFTLRNMSEVPLALSHLVHNPITGSLTASAAGSSSQPNGDAAASTPASVNSPRLFMYLVPRASGQSMGALPPQVEVVGRRLVLAPRETLELDCRLDRSELGWILALTPADRITFNGLAALDPRGFTPDGRIAIGPLGATEPIVSIARSGAGMSSTNLDQFLAMLNDADVIAQMRAISWLVQTAPRWSGAAVGTNPLERIDQALTDRFNRFDNLRQAWMVRFLMADSKGQPMFPRVHELAQRSEDPLVRMVYLASQVSDPKSAALDAADRSSNPRISQFAAVWRPTLQALIAAEAAKRAAAAKESQPK